MGFVSFSLDQAPSIWTVGTDLDLVIQGANFPSNVSRQQGARTRFLASPQGSKGPYYSYKGKKPLRNLTCNIDTKNGWVLECISFQIWQFWVSMLVFEGVTPIKWPFLHG